MRKYPSHTNWRFENENIVWKIFKKKKIICNFYDHHHIHICLYNINSYSELINFRSKTVTWRKFSGGQKRHILVIYWVANTKQNKITIITLLSDLVCDRFPSTSAHAVKIGFFQLYLLLSIILNYVIKLRIWLTVTQ